MRCATSRSRSPSCCARCRPTRERLREHVQLEEYELFSYLEQALDPAVLQHIGDRLTGER
jgi:arsenate reductase-like glutaredoxin family protein